MYNPMARCQGAAPEFFTDFGPYYDARALPLNKSLVCTWMFINTLLETKGRSPVFLLATG